MIISQVAAAAPFRDLQSGLGVKAEGVLLHLVDPTHSLCVAPGARMTAGAERLR